MIVGVAVFMYAPKKLSGAVNTKTFNALLVGAGGLGTAVALGLVKNWQYSSYLTLRILDSEAIELSNLNRQVLFDSDALGKHKASYLAERLKQYTEQKNINIEPLKTRFDSTNAMTLIDGIDYIFDATDHSSTKFLINDLCVEKRIAFCHGGALAYRGQTLSVNPKSGYCPPCLRCVFGDYNNKDCQAEDERIPGAGILGPVAGMTGFLQATECLRYYENRQQEAGCSRLLRFSASDLVVHCSDLSWAPNCGLAHGELQS
jgi:molybdopterin/thiamine biosynthesis adenylyltransferase